MKKLLAEVNISEGRDGRAHQTPVQGARAAPGRRLSLIDLNSDPRPQPAPSTPTSAARRGCWPGPNGWSQRRLRSST
jgi:hypothetical protein